MTFVEWIRSFLTGVSFWATVRPWEQGVRIWRGKHRTLLGPGLYGKIPVLHSVIVYPIRTRTDFAPLQTLRSRDGRTITVGLIVKYRIADLLKVMESMHNPVQTLMHMAQGALGELVPTLDAAEITPERIAAHVLDKVPAESLGIGGFSVLVSDNADLSQRTFRLMSSDRWSNTDGEIDRLGRQA